MEFLVNEESELDEVILALKPHLQAGEIFLLQGDLGAGKTTLIRRICEHLHTQDEVSSPTFSLVNEYLTPTVKIYHFDLYRVEEPEELLDFGFEEYLAEDALVFIEWPEMAEDLLPPHVIRLELEHDEGGGRRIRVNS